MTYRPRWDVGLAAALTAGLLGVLLGSATVVAAGLVGLAFGAYGLATKPPEATVQVAREVDDDSPAPGADVTVTVTVRNASDAPLAELRIVDEPPEDLPVVDGTPALCTSLGGDERTSFEYTVRARRGSHEFGESRVLVRNVSGTVERTRTVDLPTEVTCRAGLDELPLSSQTTQYAGRVDADAPGEGVAFHSTRQFRPSDPLHRIDWKRYAKDRELTTVQFQETRAATIVLLVDVRSHVRVARRPGEHDAVEFCAFAAARIAGAHLAASNRVGAALYGGAVTHPGRIDDDTAYLPPGVGRDQRVRVGEFLRDAIEGDDPDGSEDGSASDRFRTDPFFFDFENVGNGGAIGRPSGADGQAAPDGGAPAVGRRTAGDPRTDGGRWSLTWLTRRLPEAAQVVFCTPLLDDRSANTARNLDARGHEVTVVSPDVTTTETPGGLVSRIERRQRLASLRADLRLVEWSPDEAIATAVGRTAGRWR